MQSLTGVAHELTRLENVNKNAVDSKTEQAIQYYMDALKWVLGEESTPPFDALGLEE
jgi:hypothetical protein